MKKLFFLLCVLFAFSCTVENEDLKSSGLTVEEMRAKIKTDREAEYKAYLETEEGQKKITETILQGKSGRGGGSDATHCDCMYAISSVEVDLDGIDDFEYNLTVSEECDAGSIFGCGYFSAYYSTIHPVCFGGGLNDQCYDILDGTYPLYAQPFNCPVPLFDDFNVYHDIVGLDPVSCDAIFIGASSITFTIQCCDRAKSPGSDLNNCGEPSQCYSTGPMTINLDGGWDNDALISLSLEGCGCELTL